jgi:exodeoxyribonuclease VII small subunit
MPDPAADPPRPADGPRFEEALAEVEGLVEELESGRLSLEDALERYERGVRRLAQCRKLLEGAERKVDILRKTVSGELKAEPFEPGA